MRDKLDQTVVEGKRGHRLGSNDGSSPPALLLVVNGHASGIHDPQRSARELLALLQGLGVSASVAITQSEPDLWQALRSGADGGRRVALVGGDGSLHAAANAPVPALPELALIPSGRANNIAHALGIPVDPASAVEMAAFGPARPLDALLVETPQRSLYAVEGVSVGFQAEARGHYRSDNSADLLQGVRALFGALRRYRPVEIKASVDDADLGLRSAAELFLSNLPYFGFGFEVDPGADPRDGRFEAISFEAPNRRTLIRELAATYRGHHLGRPGVHLMSGRRAELSEPVAMVADAEPLGVTTATVTVAPARLAVVSPARGKVQ